MLFNTWNEPEDEIIEAAINRFVGKLSEDDLAYIIRYEKFLEEERTMLFEQMMKKYNIVPEEKHRQYFMELIKRREKDYF